MRFQVGEFLIYELNSTQYEIRYKERSLFIEASDFQCMIATLLAFKEGMRHRAT